MSAVGCGGGGAGGAAARASVPIEISAASFISVSTSSARMSEKSSSLHLVRIRIRCTTLPYMRLSGTIFPSSGKCQPYHSFSRIAYVLSSLSRSSSSPIACTIIVSTLSGENLSLYRESECASPICIERISAPDAASIKFSIWLRSPRISCITESSHTHWMLSFSLIAPPSFESPTASTPCTSLLTTFFLRNFFMPALSLPSTSAVADCTASAVSSNLWNCFSFTSFRVEPTSWNASHRSSGFFILLSSSTLKSAWPAGVSKRTSIFCATSWSRRRP